MGVCAYRSLDAVVHERVAELLDRRARAAPLVDSARRVAAKRVARAAGGAVGLAMSIAMFASGLASCGASYSEQPRLRTLSTQLLLSSWIVAIVIALVVRVATSAAWRSRVARIFVPTGDWTGDLARLEARDPLRDLRERAMKWERASTMLPLAAVSMLAPLTIHWVAIQGWSTMSGSPLTSADSYGEWIAWSAALVGHAHVALAIGAASWAYKLRTRETCAVETGVTRAWAVSLLVSAGVACLPGAVLALIPPLLVAITGVAFVPFAFSAVARAVVRERLALEAFEA